jgi:hypothetical protein
VPPTGGWLAPKFSVREQIDSGGTVWRHNPGLTEYTWFSKFQGWRAAQRFPSGSRVRHAESPAAHHFVPVLPAEWDAGMSDHW